MLFLTAQQVELVQFDPCQAGLERAATSDDQINLRLAQACLVVVGVEKSSRATTWHRVPLRSSRMGLAVPEDRQGKKPKRRLDRVGLRLTMQI